MTAAFSKTYRNLINFLSVKWQCSNDRNIFLLLTKLTPIKSVTKIIISLLWKLKLYYYIYKNHQLTTILCQTNPA
jgi:hypothetical protein